MTIFFFCSKIELSITKGDKNNMDAKEISMFRFLDGIDKKFIIPVYQRSYIWRHENCELLLKDLINVYENNYASHFFVVSYMFLMICRNSLISFGMI